MKKIFLSTMFLAAIGLGFTGCLKDKGFEDNEYGINDPDDSPAGVGFPWAYNPDINISSVSTVTTAQTVDAPAILILSGEPAPQDLHINLVANQALVTAYNATATTPLSTFAAGAYSIPSLKVTIPAGSRVGFLKITVPTTTGLSLSNIYGLGFTIQSVDEAGYTIADNLKNIVIGINVKNQYDAFYTTSGYFFHPTAQRGLADHKRLSTVSAVGCRAGLADLYTQNFFFTFDVSATNTLINWLHSGGTPPVPASGFMTVDVTNPAGVNPYPAGGSEKPGIAPWLHSTYNNTYNPSTKTFWMHYGYAVGSSSQTGYTRQGYEKWVRD